MAYHDASVSTLNFPSLLGGVNTSWLIILFFNSSNAFWYSSFYFYFYLSLSLLRDFMTEVLDKAFVEINES